MLVLKVSEVVHAINIVPDQVVWEGCFLKFRLEDWVDLFG
jgi:hypothetical protein